MSSTLQPEQNNSQFSITGYGDGFVEINRKKWYQSCIVSTSSNPISWKPTCINDVSESNLSVIKTLNPEILILGTGKTHNFLPPHLICFNINEDEEIYGFLGVKNNKNTSLNIECMSTAAACRTFNILASEDRKVVAAILITGENEL